MADAMELVALARCGGHNSVTVFYSQTDAVIRPGMWAEGSGQGLRSQLVWNIV